MGSSRSGWYRGRKATVEECQIIDARGLARACLGAGPKVRVPAPTSDVRLECEPPQACGDGFLVQVRKLWFPDGDFAEIEQLISLEPRPSAVGGRRWQVSCPRCNQSVRKLHLPPHRDYFACRQCHDLSYRSVQTHDKRRDHEGLYFLAKLLGPRVMSRMLRQAKRAQ